MVGWLMRASLAVAVTTAGVSAHGQSPTDSPIETLRQLLERPAVRVAALERLARSGDRSARDALAREADAASSTLEGQAALASLVRLGDTAAAKRAAELLKQTSEPLSLIEALADAKTTAAGPALVTLLQDEDPSVRSGAAVALGLVGYTAAAQPLRRTLDDRWGTARAGAAVGLYRLGDTSVEQTLETLVGVPSPEVLLTAARAWAPDVDGAWVSEVQRLLLNPAWELRHPAAELLHRLRPAEVRGALRRDLDPGMPPTVRSGAARIYERIAVADDRTFLRQLLTDSDPHVQVHAAGALLRVASITRGE